jgi:hypothetical protein
MTSKEAPAPEQAEPFRDFVRELFAEKDDDIIWKSPATEEPTEGK